MNKYDKRMNQLTAFGGHETLQKEVLQDIIHVKDEDLAEAERQIGYPLPKDYREFLRDYGGVFVASGVVVKDAASHSMCFCEVSSFYGVNMQHPSHDLVPRYQMASQYLPPHLLPIAVGDSDPGLTVMSLAGEDREKIYCYRDMGDEQEMCLIAHSFDEFLSLIAPREGAG